MVEYIIVLVVIVNIVIFNWEFGVKVICILWMNCIFGLMIWVLLGLVVYIFGIIGLWFCVCGW